jgi:hypothetical protein
MGRGVNRVGGSNGLDSILLLILVCICHGLEPRVSSLYGHVPNWISMKFLGRKNVLLREWGYRSWSFHLWGDSDWSTRFVTWRWGRGVVSWSLLRLCWGDVLEVLV